MPDAMPAAQPKPPPPAGLPPTRRWSLLGGLALLTVAAAAVHHQAAAPGADTVDVSETTRRIAGLAAAGPLPLSQVGQADMTHALSASELPAGDSSALAADASAGRVRLVWLSLYDSDVEDGDVAEIRSGGFSRAVRLTKAPVAIAVPVGPDNTITVAGLVDGGGGGVTVGLVLPGGPLPLPPLSVGQTLRLPIGRPR